MNNHLPANAGETYKYTGFWPRVGASLIDTIILCAICYPLLVAIYGWGYFTRTSIVSGTADLLISWVFPALAVIAFWVYRQATPGKMAISAKVVDAKTGKEPTTGQCIIRYLGYFVSVIPLCLGLFWVAWDSKKQGWHDKLAGTVVISPKEGATEKVAFEGN